MCISQQLCNWTMHSRNFAKNLQNCSPTVMHLTHAFWRTWHLMDQTWHFYIRTMAWQFWYPEFPELLVVRDLPTRCSSFPQGLLARTLLSPAPPPLFFPRAQLGDTIHRRVLSFLHATDLEAVRDVNSTTYDFVDWRIGRPRFTETAVTCDFVDWRRRATEIPAQRKNLARSASNKKRSRTKIVGSTILGNAKSKIPNN